MVFHVTPFIFPFMTFLVMNSAARMHAPGKRKAVIAMTGIWKAGLFLCSMRVSSIEKNLPIKLNSVKDDINDTICGEDGSVGGL